MKQRPSVFGVALTFDRGISDMKGISPVVAMSILKAAILHLLFVSIESGIFVRNVDRQLYQTRYFSAWGLIPGRLMQKAFLSVTDYGICVTLPCLHHAADHCSGMRIVTIVEVLPHHVTITLYRARVLIKNNAFPIAYAGSKGHIFQIVEYLFHCPMDFLIVQFSKKTKCIQFNRYLCPRMASVPFYTSDQQ